MKNLYTNPYAQIAQTNKIMDTEMKAHEQHAARPKIDDVICHYLDGETLKKALQFIDNLYSNGMKIKWNDVNVWSVHYRFKHICDIAIERGALKVYQISNSDNIQKDQFVYDTESMKNMMSILRNSLVGHQKAYQASH